MSGIAVGGTLGGLRNRPGFTPPVGSRPSITPSKGAPQKMVASLTHDASHESSQQSGSAAHTIWQQPPSLQPGFRCSVKQLPLAGFPHTPSSHSHDGVFRASSTQLASQRVSQQKESSAHTAVQHASFEQCGTGLATQQFGSSSLPHVGAGQASSWPSQNSRAVEAQSPSQTLSQQKGSSWQTAVQHSAFWQFGALLGTQQLGSRSLPHGGSGQASFLPVQELRASAAQAASQRTSQQ